MLAMTSNMSLVIMSIFEKHEVSNQPMLYNSTQSCREMSVSERILEASDQHEVWDTTLYGLNYSISISLAY
jgi:hypothetical protein